MADRYPEPEPLEQSAVELVDGFSQVMRTLR